MPIWLRKQLKRAYAEKNRYQVKILNQCWFYYQRKEKKGKNA
ncbi:cortex morphogenetic protein CmpA [Halalkalibacter urbisdiaboli]|nr:cortex morphogenetic protein CmpA [Halalkalibacter urbisdiaboli]